jgi:uncharacterized protein
MMGDVSGEPTMEDILASIKKIISEDTDRKIAPPVARRGDARDDVDAGPRIATSAPELTPEEDILDLTEASIEPEPIATIPQIAEPAPVESAQPAARPVPPLSTIMPTPAKRPDPLLSTDTVAATRNSLEALSAMIVRPAVPNSDTLEGLVAELLKPMLKEWMDANLPELVERIVQQEVARITGRL